MRPFSSVAALLATTLFAWPLVAQNLPLPGCETAPQVNKILDEKLDSKTLDKLKMPERIALERQVLEDLIAHYPRELTPYQTLVNRLSSENRDEAPALRNRMVQMAKDHPEDPLALMLAGWALRGKNTPESLRLLQASIAKAPNFPWPYKELAGDYFSGKIADPAKVRENIEAFFAICPASTDSYAQWLLAKDPALQPKVAVALRARLEKEMDPKRLRDYEILWGLEFRVRPPTEHDALRAQVTKDLKRLESLNPHGDSEWQAFLINGYKQSGASQETITAMQDTLLREYPHSEEALDIVRSRWDKTHKDPEDQADAAAWTKHEKEYEKALKGWMRDFPDDVDLQRYEWYYAIQGDDTIGERDGIAALDTFLESVQDYEPHSFWLFNYANAAQFLLDHHWQPERALKLTQEARTLDAQAVAREQDDDNLSDDDVKNRAEEKIWKGQFFVGLELRAARQAGRSDEVMQLRSLIEARPPADKKFQSGYWVNRARFEALQNHTQDALAYYQLALETRTDPPKAIRGRLRDDLTDEARALWKARGGTEEAWAVWSRPPSGSADKPGDGFWEKPTKTIPTFELSDLSGKTWRLKELTGKTVLITVWATWCGPCEAELPHLEKFYEKFKDRSDIQVLTFDIDEDLGLVAPYLKEKGYTFPVLPAYSTVVTLLDGFAIPQNWLIDPHGMWRWKQVGYGGGSDADFEKEMLTRLESTKSGQ
ncbi:MAG TPA: TlpA disulfide reductase family protein [Verrucomicrobiae bacterium]|nr:TlpA disulfide reductase family protein [Verrucomicrobiae bacterium]